MILLRETLPAVIILSFAGKQKSWILPAEGNERDGVFFSEFSYEQG
jgi:hypothetical protein